MINPGINSRAASFDLNLISETDPAVCHSIMLNRPTLGNIEIITYFPELHNLRDMLLNPLFQQSFITFTAVILDFG